MGTHGRNTSTKDIQDFGVLWSTMGLGSVLVWAKWSLSTSLVSLGKLKPEWG